MKLFESFRERERLAARWASIEQAVNRGMVKALAVLLFALLLAQAGLYIHHHF